MSLTLVAMDPEFTDHAPSGHPRPEPGSVENLARQQTRDKSSGSATLALPLLLLLPQFISVLEGPLP